MRTTSRWPRSPASTRATIIDVTWAAAGLLAGLAGILYAAAIGTINPNFGVTILLSLFAAAILGGIGNAYGALVGGIVIGLAQEWSTLFFNPRWKPAVGFAILILTLLFMPHGIFGQASATLMSLDFWIGVGVLAGIYGIFTLGLQLNVGFTGLPNFGQAGFHGDRRLCHRAAGRRLRAGRSGRHCPPASLLAVAAGPVRRPSVAAPALRLFRHRHHRLCRDRPLHPAER